MSLNFVAIDFETANESRKSICSVGLSKVENGEIVDEYYTLINPEEYFDPFNTGIHGITEDMVKDSPTYPEVRNNIINFIGELPIVAHYAPFDTGAIRDANEKYNLIHFNVNYFCSYALSRSLLSLVSYNLDTVAKEFNYKFKHHNALDDSKACAAIVLGLSRKFELYTLIELTEKAGYKKLGYINSEGWHGFRKTQKSSYTYVDILKQLQYPNIEELDQDNEFFGRQVAFTGTLSSMARKQAMQKIINVGGIPQNGLNKHTNYLIMGEQDLKKLNGETKSSKIKRAEELLSKGSDIQLIGEKDFIRMIK